MVSTVINGYSSSNGIFVGDSSSLMVDGLSLRIEELTRRIEALEKEANIGFKESL